VTTSESQDAGATPTTDASPGLFVGPVPGRAAPLAPGAMASPFQTVAWRAPGTNRFDGRPANDFLIRAEAIAPQRLHRRTEAHPVATTPAGWFTFTIGACIAATLGALLGILMAT